MYTMSSAPDMEAMDPTLRLTRFEDYKERGKEESEEDTDQGRG